MHLSHDTSQTNVSLVLGVLVECDPSIKSIIVKIDSEEHAFIVEDLDDQTLVIKENMLAVLKMRLDEVCNCVSVWKATGLIEI